MFEVSYNLTPHYILWSWIFIGLHIQRIDWYLQSFHCRRWNACYNICTRTEAPYLRMFQKWNYFLSLWPLLFPAWLWHRLWFFQRMLLPWLPLIYIGCSELRKRPAFISFIHSCIKAWFSWVFGSLLSFQSFSSWFSCQKMAFRFRSWCHVLLLILSQEWYSAFIDLNEKRGISMKYKDDFTIGTDGVPICKAGRKMNHDGSEPSKTRLKFRCPLASRKYGCSCSTPCSDSKYGRTVHLAMKDNPRLINFPPRDSEEWKLEYNARTSAERSNKREKIDFQLESGRHHSTKMWYCRLYHILMLQHLDVWDLPFESTLAKLILNVA